jgi:hypothetical protein
MKKILIPFSLLISLNSYSQTKVNEIKVFEGRYNSYFMIEGELGFCINNTTIYFRAGRGDKTYVECKVDEQLDSDIETGLLERGTKLRVKAKAVYVNYSPFGLGKTYKQLVWKPIEITRMAK